MGLDVYLYERAAHEQNTKHDAEWESLWEQKERGDISEAEYDARQKKITSYARHIDAPSKINPEHLFNRRYLRSSYNEGGFNSVARNISGHDLYWIFEPLEVHFDDWDGALTPEHLPALEESQERAKQVAAEIQSWDGLQVTELRGPLLGGADHLWAKYPTKDQVLAWGRDELSREHAIKGAYSSAKGSVFPDGFEVLAVTQGASEFGFTSAVTTYAVVRADKESTEHYAQSALITAEFCDEAAVLVRRDGGANMSWSG